MEPNRIHCGDFLELSKQITGKFRCIIMDPPYNIGYDFGNDSDRRPMAEYVPWCKACVDRCFELLAPGGLLYLYGFAEIVMRVAVHYPSDRQRWLAWHYTNKNVHSSKFWQRSHETIVCLWQGNQPKLCVDAIRDEYTPAHQQAADRGAVRKSTKGRFNPKGRQTVFLDHGGALPRDVIKIPALAGGAGRRERWFGCRTCGLAALHPDEKEQHREHDIWSHPTQKPAALTEKLVKSIIDVGGEKGASDRVLIPFAGSGAECAAISAMGLDWTATEINPEFVEFGNEMLRRKAASAVLAGSSLLTKR